MSIYQRLILERELPSVPLEERRRSMRYRRNLDVLVDAQRQATKLSNEFRKAIGLRGKSKFKLTENA
jgi:hypothetical protein